MSSIKKSFSTSLSDSRGKKRFELVDFSDFVTRFMSGPGTNDLLNSNAVKIFPLNIAPFLIRKPVPLFRAQYNYLLIFTAGGGVQQVDSTLIELKVNDILFIREGHLNTVKQIFPDTEGYFIYLEDQYTQQVFSGAYPLQALTFNPKVSMTENEISWIEKLCEALYELDSVASQHLEIQLSLLRSIFLRIAERTQSSGLTGDRKWQIFISFKSLLYEYSKKERRLDFYADLLHVSSNYLNRCVKEVSGRSPKQHLLEMAITYSKLLLQDPNNDVSKVAFELNFSDPSYFGRLFKEVVGHTPSGYRKMLMHD